MSQTAPPPKSRCASEATRARRNAWHIAADWVEAFSPVVHNPVRDELRAQGTGGPASWPP